MQSIEQLGIIRMYQLRASHHYDIKALQHGLMMAEAFPDNTLDSITQHGLFGNLAGDGQSQPGMIQVVGPSQYSEKCIAAFRRFCENSAVIGFGHQTGTTRKMRIAHTMALNERAPWPAEPLARHDRLW